MRTLTLYNAATGELGRVLTLPEHAIRANVPEGCGYKEGRYDKRKQRVDLETGAIVDYRAPEDPRVVAARRATDARVRIAALEHAQARPLRELAIDPNNAEAKRRLDTIEREIARLRGDLVPDGARSINGVN